MGARRALTECLSQEAVAEAARAAVGDDAGAHKGQSQEQLMTLKSIPHDAGLVIGAGRKITSEEVRKAPSYRCSNSRELAQRWATARSGRRAQAHPDPQLGLGIHLALKEHAKEAVGNVLSASTTSPGWTAQTARIVLRPCRGCAVM